MKRERNWRDRGQEADFLDAVSSFHFMQVPYGQICKGGIPSFIKTPEDQTGISGGVASFVCQAVGEPKPRITWMKKGKKVSSQRFEVVEFDDGSGSVLRIQPLRTHRDEAIYECTATNSFGEINTSAKLTVLEAYQSSISQDCEGKKHTHSLPQDWNMCSVLIAASVLASVNEVVRGIVLPPPKLCPQETSQCLLTEKGSILLQKKKEPDEENRQKVHLEGRVGD
ncbi:Receptor-type tyrosine-protein phosphatase F [Anabarilius grahami]|uniref:Receptor-type tyrosine-protein phosphatase F n=1 Tax=Anabarilius grahami TaxID=495550 RepID=A0A3N0Y708_ANAGA|nr:Receptor-type tyrosine-protein phosphatase F [Anabarilius grahami]